MHLLFLLAGVLFSFSLYIHQNFIGVPFEQYLYALMYSDGTSSQALIEGILFVLIGTFCFYLIVLCIIYLKNYKQKTILTISWKKHRKDFIIFPFQHVLCLSIICFVISIYILVNTLQLDTYIVNQMTESEFYERYYVDPKNVEITFPEKKRNLIYIYLEAYESGFVGKDNGGDVEQSLIPGLETLALENLNFSQHEKIGGASVLHNTSWTIAGMVAQTAGITLNIPIEENGYRGYSTFLPGVTSLGEILEDNGYHNYFMLGSDANFGGRKQYFEQHGNYEVYDYYDALSKLKVWSSQYVWWGYEDRKLFDFAKDELLNIANKNEPFNFTMITVDTHFPTGYLDNSCKDLPFDSQYPNVYYCNSNMVYEFVRWIQKQDFYENTTIIISGDHYSTKVVDGVNSSQRTYNVLINSAVDTIYNLNREFATVDLFPTTLAALGASIKGERLGLGTNLFSGYPTLIEQLGFDTVDKEVAKKSDYYNSRFLGNSYDEMLDKIEKEEVEEREVEK